MDRSRDKLDNLGVKAGIYCKFVSHVLTELMHRDNILFDAVLLIMSRGLKVIVAHYLSTRKWSDKLFGIYIDWLKRNNLI